MYPTDFVTGGAGGDHDCCTEQCANELAYVRARLMNDRITAALAKRPRNYVIMTVR